MRMSDGMNKATTYLLTLYRPFLFADKLQIIGGLPVLTCIQNPDIISCVVPDKVCAFKVELAKEHNLCVFFQNHDVLIDGCSLALCLVTVSVVSDGICNINKVNSINCMTLS